MFLFVCEFLIIYHFIYFVTSINHVSASPNGYLIWGILPTNLQK